MTTTLVRHSKTLLEILGLACRIKRPWRQDPCDGRLLVRDWHPSGVRGEFRYEIYCIKCGACDPNGWATQDQIVPGAVKHFRATK